MSTCNKNLGDCKVIAPRLSFLFRVCSFMILCMGVPFLVGG